MTYEVPLIRLNPAWDNSNFQPTYLPGWGKGIGAKGLALALRLHVGRQWHSQLTGWFLEHVYQQRPHYAQVLHDNQLMETFGVTVLRIE